MSSAQFDPGRAGRQILVVLGLILLANGAFYFFYTRPAVQSYTGLLDEVPGSDALEERREDVERTESFLLAVKQAEQDLQSLRDEVLSSRDKRMVLVQLELADLAQQFRIDLDSVNYQTDILEEENLDRFAMDVPLEGGYIALRRFLQAVEDSDEFMVVERVALAKGKQGGVLLQLNITLATYFNAPQPEASRRGSNTSRRRKPADPRKEVEAGHERNP